MKKLARVRETIYQLLGPMRVKYFALYVLAVFSALLEMFSVGLILPLAEAVTQNSASVELPGIFQSMINALSRLSLLQLASILLVVFAGKSLFKLLVTYGNSRIVQEMRGVWMTKLFEKYAHQHYLFFVSAKHGTLMYNMFDLCQRTVFGLKQLLGLFLHGATLLLTLALLVTISWQLTLASVVFLGVGYLAVNRPMLGRSNVLGKNILSTFHDASALASEVLREFGR